MTLFFTSFTPVSQVRSLLDMARKLRQAEYFPQSKASPAAAEGRLSGDALWGASDRVHLLQVSVDDDVWIAMHPRSSERRSRFDLLIFSSRCKRKHIECSPHSILASVSLRGAFSRPPTLVVPFQNSGALSPDPPRTACTAGSGAGRGGQDPARAHRRG